MFESCGFDQFVENLCRPFYAKSMGRPSLAPGVDFRVLMVGYFEGIDSERGMAWRAADSLGIRAFLGMSLEESTPDQTTISRTRRLGACALNIGAHRRFAPQPLTCQVNEKLRRAVDCSSLPMWHSMIDVETHETVFAWVLSVLAEHGLVRGKTIGIDATTLEANAALRSIVRRDTGKAYEEFLRRLAKESGIPTPTRAQLARLDRKRAKKGSNQEWTHPHDPDARLAKMKDGRTHLTHKAEHAVDMETGAVVAVTVQAANAGDMQTVHETLAQAAEHIVTGAEAVNAATDAETVAADGPREVVADKGYHSREAVRAMQQAGIPLTFPSPSAERRNGSDKLPSSGPYMRIGGA